MWCDVLVHTICWLNNKRIGQCHRFISYICTSHAICGYRLLLVFIFHVHIWTSAHTHIYLRFHRIESADAADLFSPFFHYNSVLIWTTAFGYSGVHSSTFIHKTAKERKNKMKKKRYCEDNTLFILRFLHWMGSTLCRCVVCYMLCVCVSEELLCIVCVCVCVYITYIILSFLFSFNIE